MISVSFSCMFMYLYYCVCILGEIPFGEPQEALPETFHYWETGSQEDL